MLTPPEDTSLDAVAEAVSVQFGVDVAPLRFVPAGEDSWNMVAAEHWVSVRRDLRGHVPAAYRLARELEDAGTRSVVAPLRGLSGDVIGSVGGRPLLVFPLVDAVPLADHPAATTATTATEVVDLLGPVHRHATGLALPAETFDLPFEGSLRDSLDWATHPAADRPGPLSDPLRDALVRERGSIVRLLDETRELAARCRAARLPQVVTHGDVSDRNVLRGPSGLRLIDWGGAMLAPVERDWFHVGRCFGRAPRGDAQAERYYRNRWVASELEEYATVLRHPHHGHADDLAMWQRFTAWLEVARGGPVPAGHA